MEPFQKSDRNHKLGIWTPWGNLRYFQHMSPGRTSFARIGWASKETQRHGAFPEVRSEPNWTLGKAPCRCISFDGHPILVDNVPSVTTGTRVCSVGVRTYRRGGTPSLVPIRPWERPQVSAFPSTATLSWWTTSSQ